jgi:hypothetical protein
LVQAAEKVNRQAKGLLHVACKLLI